MPASWAQIGPTTAKCQPDVAVPHEAGQSKIINQLVAGYVCTPRRPLHGGRDGGEAVVPLVPSRSGERPGGRLRGGYEGAEGWAVSLALHLINRDPSIYPEPERFDPNRFEPGREEHHKHPRVYPAGIGPADQPSVSRAGILDTPQARIPRGPRPRYDWRLPRAAARTRLGQAPAEPPMA